MDKRSFIEQLRRSLAVIDDYAFVNDTVSFYENYIDNEIRSGKTEEEVMEELGDARLIAKSIIASREREEESEYSGPRFYEETRENSGRRRGKDRTVFQFNNRMFQLPTWLVKVVTFVVLLVICVAVFSFLGWLLPVLIRIALPIALAYFVYQLIVRRM